MKMKKVKPNLRAMFNFHTIILVILMVVLSTLHSHTIEGKLQTNHKHHHHHYKQHNVVGGGIDTDIENVADKLEQQPGHHNHQHSQHHHQQHHHQHHHQPHQQQYTATPSLEFTTSSSASSSSAAFMDSDNEFLIKQQELPLTNKDEIYYKTKDLKSSSATSSTTSKPSLSIQLMKQHVGNMKTSSSNTTTTTTTAMQSETLSNSRQEHTHLKHYNSKRLISTPSTKHQASSSGGDHGDGDGGIDNNRSDTIATMYSVPNENSKWNLATTKDNDDIKLNKPAEHQNQTHNEHHHHQRDRDHEHDQKMKPEQPAHQNYEDYYSDAEDDDDDDDYNEDEGDNDNIDGISYDDDNNLSDRSYARITRSKLDDDYIDDEPYRNGLNDLSMQRDAPGVLTEQKYLDVGNEKAVQQARERYIQEQKRPRTPQELATEHWHRMIQATKCRKPLPRVIPVSNNTSKRYEPYATILHRCGDDTGCCGSTASVCTVKRHEIVMVYVFSYDFNYRKEIEALPMQNHTECHCVNRGSLLHDSMPRDKRSGGSGAGGGLGSTSYLHHFQRQQRKQQHRQSQPQSQQQLQSHHQQQLQNMLDCHCPRHFNVFEEDVERHAHLPKPHSVFIRKCRCDCLVNNQTCLRFKHGEEGFSLEDRKCILERNCKPPVCSYGEYNLRVGRCPSYYRSHLLQTT
ncbi:DNA topoisomerase 1-like [Calliphora vicina]|uniref:DNA topoisomerase 1-like n=1 Tax=Calliphora vicina TaxID=7373 RepID=UPI00325BEB66